MNIKKFKKMIQTILDIKEKGGKIYGKWSLYKHFNIHPYRNMWIYILKMCRKVERWIWKGRKMHVYMIDNEKINEYLQVELKKVINIIDDENIIKLIKLF